MQTPHKGQSAVLYIIESFFLFLKNIFKANFNKENSVFGLNSNVKQAVSL